MANRDNQLVLVPLLFSWPLPATCCYHGSNMEPVLLWGPHWSSWPVSLKKDTVSPSLVPGSFCGEKGKDLFPGK